MQAGLAWAILTPWGWRWLVAISSAPLLALMLLYPLLPESPYWLLATGRTPEVVALLQRIAHANGRDLPPGRLQPALSGKSKVGGLISCCCLIQRPLVGCPMCQSGCRGHSAPMGGNSIPGACTGCTGQS